MTGEMAGHKSEGTNTLPQRSLFMARLIKVDVEYGGYALCSRYFHGFYVGQPNLMIGCVISSFK